jgi:hypothetical protein
MSESESKFASEVISSFSSRESGSCFCSILPQFRQNARINERQNESGQNGFPEIFEIEDIGIHQSNTWQKRSNRGRFPQFTD